MHACGPVMNVSRLPKTLGMALTVSGMHSQRSGLQAQIKLVASKLHLEAKLGLLELLCVLTPQ